MTFFFSLTLSLSLSALVLAESQDDQLNAAYHEALASKKLDPESLKWIELHWIPFRDAEANLQAWISGKSLPDEAARQASIEHSTKVRLADLIHVAADGKSADLSVNYSTGDLAVAEAYSSLRQQVLAKNNPHLTAALISDQKAWLEFSELQADYDGGISSPGKPDEMRAASAARLNGLRLSQLKADANALGISLAAPQPANGDEPDIGIDRNTEVSPDDMIRIEQDDQNENNVQAWIISNTTGERALLPMKNDEADTGRDKPTVSISEFAISPDHRWIFRTQKFYHGMCGAYLYQQISGLQYKAATEKPLDMLAWNFFKKAAPADNVDVTEGGVVNFSSWGHDYLRISLNASERLTFGNVNDWLVDYNLRARTFSVSAELKEHDRRSF
jgi:uncharacterized protein YecT (DUF1311 family)